MKLLLDQNLSFKLCQRLSDIFPQSTQARIIGMDQDPDQQLWDYAKQNEYAIVRKTAISRT
jgi:predicted nuclease of predicted toxin-antitoxin system